MPVTPQKTPVEARVQEHIAFARGTTAPGMFHETAAKALAAERITNDPLIPNPQTWINRYGLQPNGQENDHMQPAVLVFA